MLAAYRQPAGRRAGDPMTTSRRAQAVAVPAYVLHRWDWSESSLIVDVLTRDFGRIVIAARGAKRAHSNLRAVLLPLQRVAITLGRGDADNEVRALRGAEYGGGAPMPRGPALFAGFYLNELLLKLVARNDAHPRLFDAYAATLAMLASGDAETQAALRAFELVLLRETGVLPDLKLETATQKALSADGRYALAAETGLVASRGAANLDAATLTALQDALQANDIAALRRACMRRPAPLKEQLRQVLDYHLSGAALGSREAVRQLRRLSS